MPVLKIFLTLKLRSDGVELVKRWSCFCFIVQNKPVFLLMILVVVYYYRVLIICFSLCCKSQKISSAPSGHPQCCLSWCASSTCCRACCSSLASLPSPWCVTVFWVWSWCPCWRGPSSATLVGTGLSEEPSTRPQVSFWSRWERCAWWSVIVSWCLFIWLPELLVMSS